MLREILANATLAVACCAAWFPRDSGCVEEIHLERLDFDLLPLKGEFSFGARIVGLARESLTDETVRKRLFDLWVEKGVLVFDGVTDSKFQVELSGAFGELELHAVASVRGVKYPELAAARFHPESGTLYEVDGDLRADWLPWHTDTIYDDHLHRGTSLRPVIIPSRLGRTGFIDKIEAHDALPEHLKKRLANVEVIYKRDFNLDKQPFVTNKVRYLRYPPGFDAVHQHAATLPRALHPAVFLYKDLGRKAFNISPHPAFGIYGMENEEGDALLREAIKCGIDDAKAYFHEWEPDQMVVWDNWRLLHCAEGGPPDEERWLERAQIAGDYGFGRWEPAAADLPRR